MNSLLAADGFACAFIVMWYPLSPVAALCFVATVLSSYLAGVNTCYLVSGSSIRALQSGRYVVFYVHRSLERSRLPGRDRHAAAIRRRKRNT